jgi:hypothetical protein
MPRKTSVTSRGRRNVTVRRQTWQDSIDPEGIAYLDAYRIAKSGSAPPPAQFGGLMEWLTSIAESSKDFPIDPQLDQPTTIVIDKSVVELLHEHNLFPALREGENVIPSGSLAVLNVVSTCTALFESGGVASRVSVYVVLGFLYRLTRPLWDRLRREQFGNEPLNQAKTQQLVSMVLEIAAKLLRGQWKPPKGRVDAERIEVINLIQRHAYRPLQPSEIHAALVRAGINVQEGETFRIWLHRMRKKGLVGAQKPVPPEIIVEFNPDGSINLSAMKLDDRRRLAHAIRSIQQQD